MGFFQNLFGKKTCALCGKECGMMHRTKVKNGEYVCSDCTSQCSKFVRLSRLTTDEVRGHIEYMRRQNRLFEEVFSTARRERMPSQLDKEGIEFCDELGMFRIVSRQNRKCEELFRYDQVASYEEYFEEDPPNEQHKEPKFKECGIKLHLVGSRKNAAEIRAGTRAHPYVQDEIRICFSSSNKKYAQDAHNAKCHFDYIFGVNDDRKGLFDFGMSKKEQRDLKAAVGMAKSFGTVFKAAREGGIEDSEELRAQMEENQRAVEDANTGGLAVYSRRADEAEARINGEG